DVAGDEADRLLGRRDRDDRPGVRAEQIGGDVAARALVERDVAQADEAWHVAGEVRAAQRLAQLGDECVGGARQGGGGDHRGGARGSSSSARSLRSWRVASTCWTSSSSTSGRAGSLARMPYSRAVSPRNAAAATTSRTSIARCESASSARRSPTGVPAARQVGS